jgi:hypothetical protein
MRTISHETQHKLNPRIIHILAAVWHVVSMLWEIGLQVAYLWSESRPLCTNVAHGGSYTKKAISVQRSRVWLWSNYGSEYLNILVNTVTVVKPFWPDGVSKVCGSREVAGSRRLCESFYERWAPKQSRGDCFKASAWCTPSTAFLAFRAHIILLSWIDSYFRTTHSLQTMAQQPQVRSFTAMLRGNIAILPAPLQCT